MAENNPENNPEILDPETIETAPVEDPEPAPAPVEDPEPAPAPVEDPEPVTAPVEDPEPAPASVEDPEPAPAPIEDPEIITIEAEEVPAEKQKNDIDWGLIIVIILFVLAIGAAVWYYFKRMEK